MSEETLTKAAANGASSAGTPAPSAPLAPDVSVVVYVDDYLENAAQMYAYVANYLRETGRTFEFVFVDDGNSKTVFAEIEGFQGFVRFAKVIRLPRCFGTGSAMSAGFQHSRGRLVLTLGSFLQIHPREIDKMFRKLDEGFDFVNGWRVNRTDSRLNRWQTNLFNWVVRKASNIDLHDTNCTLKLFRRELLQDVVVYGELYRFMPVLAARQGFLVTEVAVDQRREINRVGLYSAGTYLRRMLDLLALMFVGRFALTPLRFFGTVGAGLAGLGVLAGTYLTALKFLAGEGIAGRPLLLLAVLLIVVGVQVASVGLIGELIVFTSASRNKGYRIEKILE